jgi:restriction system protein
MSMPTHEEAMLPVLRVLMDGEAQHRRVLADRMADHFDLSAEERTALLPSGKAPVIRSRTGWALTYLKAAGLVSSARRGWYLITPAGREVVASGVAAIDNDYLSHYDAFKEFRSRSRPTTRESAASDGTVETASDVPPDEAIAEAYERLRDAVEAELLDLAREMEPRLFEQLVIDLLVRMGYGGNREEAAKAIGRSGDEGIDGVIDEDRLGLDTIYVQAKRWSSSVGRPEIQRFAGALQGQRAHKGVFITTSSFTRDATEYAGRIGTRVILIDGRRLAALMFEHDVGVTPRTSFTIKSVDSDYFEEA